MAPPLPYQLAAIRDELNDTTVRLHRLVDTLDETTWGRGPAEGKWSVARCVEHLNITSQAYLPTLRAAFEEARARNLTAKNPSYRLDFKGWMLFHAVEPPPMFRMKTPEAFVPPTIEPKEKVLEEYERLQNELIGVLDDAALLPLGKIRVVSPFDPRVKYNAYSALRLIPSHQRRHLWQAERVLRTLVTRSR